MAIKVTPDSVKFCDNGTSMRTNAQVYSTNDSISTKVNTQNTLKIVLVFCPTYPKSTQG